MKKVEASDAPEITEVVFDPLLDISIFDHYNILTNIEKLSPNNSATIGVSGINGDGGNAWNYYANGQPFSETISKTMTYNVDLDKWKSQNIYPDNIYPEIFFAPSATTWGNPPQNLDIRRNNYHLMHFENPFTVTANMTFWVEINAYRRSAVNSADLDIYLVEAGHDLSYFEEDWRNKSGVELVGSINKNDDFDHTHTENSSHHLVALSANNSATFGAKNLDINGDFWIIAYANSPNANRGWDLRYHQANLCDNSGHWFVGNQSGWTTIAQSGCPDAHIHIARRSEAEGIRDGVKVVTTATQDGQTGTKISSFYYNELPNLPPNHTSFVTPVSGGTYAGDIEILWNAATDPNNDALNYSLYLLDFNGEQIGSALALNQSELTYVLQTNIPESEIPDGQYGLKGEVCDSGNLGNDPPDPPLCTDFYLDGLFNIDNTEEIETVLEISLGSNNANPHYAKNGDSVTLSFKTSGEIISPNIEIYSGGLAVNGLIDVSSADNINWLANFTANSLDADGQISFLISSEHLDKNYYDTTDQSIILVDKASPTIISLSPANESKTVATATKYQITTNEPILITSDKKMNIKKSADNSLHESVVLSNDNVDLEGNILTITASKKLTEKTFFYVLIDDGAWTDLAGNAFGGIGDADAWHFQTGDFTLPFLKSVKITSDNKISGYAQKGDFVSLVFVTSEIIKVPSVIFSVGENQIKNGIDVVDLGNNTWLAKYQIDDNPDGLLNFIINFSDLASNKGKTVFDTTDKSSVIIDNSAPGNILANPSGGIYETSQLVVLDSDQADQIRYTQNDEILSCEAGILYSEPILVESTQDIKALACDFLGNATNIFVFSYIINEAQQNISATKINEKLIDEKLDGANLFNVSIKIKFNFSPAKNIKVALNSNPIITTTNDKGTAFFSGVVGGEHQLKIFVNNKIYTKKVLINKENNYDYKNRLVDLKINIISENLILSFAIILLLLAFLLILRKKITHIINVWFSRKSSFEKSKKKI